MAVKACQDEGQTVCGDKIEGHCGKPLRQGSGQLDLIVVVLGKCQRNDVGTCFRTSRRAAQQIVNRAARLSCLYPDLWRLFTTLDRLPDYATPILQ